MGAHPGEFDAVASQGHNHGTDSTADTGRRPNSDETALLGNLDPADTDENVTHMPPEAHFDATDPWGLGAGVRRVKAAGEAEHACSVANVEHIGVDRMVSGATAAPDVPPLLSEPLHKRKVLTHPRRLRTPQEPDRPDAGSAVDIGRHHAQHAPRYPPRLRLISRQHPLHHAPQKVLPPGSRPHGLSPCLHAPAIPGTRGHQARCPNATRCWPRPHGTRLRWAGGPMNRVALRTVGARVQLREPPNSSIFTYSSVMRAFHVLVRHTTKATPSQRP